MPEYLLRHLPHVTPTPTHLPQYMSALAAHTPNSIGAPVALAFIAVVIIALCYRAGSRRGTRD